MKLYEITEKYLGLLHEVESSDEELPLQKENVFQRLEEIDASFEDKALNVASFVKNIDYEIDALSAHIKKIQEKKKSLESKKEWLRYYLLHNMQVLEKDNIKNSFLSIILKKSPVKMEYEENMVPDDYIKMIPKVDEKKLKEDLLQGLSIEGAKLIQNEHVSIR